MGGVTKRILDNGLTVFLKEVHNAPIISLWTAYRVGSRNEPTGLTGSSHWVEHMMFKGTAAYPAGVLDREIDRIGGRWNAFTSLDCTIYHETLPAEHIQLAIKAESDRMVNAVFDGDETESERTVIISERQGSENNPLFWLREETTSTAFRVHGYHHQVIGDMIDLETMSRDDLYTHYQRHYTPNNAYVIAVGAFDSNTLFDDIQAHYGAIPSGEAPTLFSRREPEQHGERRVVVERPGETAFLRMSYHVPPATHADWVALDALDSILTGPGGGIDNKTSRLYRALIRSEIAVSISGGLNETIDPYLYTMSVTLRDGRTPQDAESVINDALADIIDNGVTDVELQRAKKQARAAFAYEAESVSNQAYWLAQSAILGEPDWYTKYIPRLAAVTVDDVQRVAAKYLQPNKRTVGWLLPTGTDGNAS